jgi:hypothetical protein
MFLLDTKTGDIILKSPLYGKNHQLPYVVSIQKFAFFSNTIFVYIALVSEYRYFTLLHRLSAAIKEHLIQQSLVLFRPDKD